MDTFTKKATNVGGCVGVIIPNEVAYKEGITKDTMLRIIVEVIPKTPLTGFELETFIGLNSFTSGVL